MLLAIGSAVLLWILLTPPMWLALRRRYRLATPADERHDAVTDDGWLLALYRYRPGRITAGREPIILCHGMLSNRFNVDLDQQTSLARFLREAGFDVWIMELRGHGGSRRAQGARSRGFDWAFDDYVRKDVPAAIRSVRHLTGALRVHWFGHSMGGVLLYAACALDGFSAAIASAALSDAPATFRPLRRGVGIARCYGRLVPVVPPALVLPFLGTLAWLFPGIMRRRYGFSGRARIMRLLSNAIIPWGSSRVLLQFCDMIGSGRFVSMDGSMDYETGASRISFPLFVLSSARKIMSEDAVIAGLERAGSACKRYVRFTRAHGCAEDTTHSNLILSETSRDEVFPGIRDWFLEHSSA